MLEVRDLRVYYRTLKGHVQAVDGVSFSILPRETLGIAGESGCGKSTLANALVLLKPPMEYIGGKVFLGKDELPIADYDAMRRFRYRRISLIPQYAMDALNPTRKLGRIFRDLVMDLGIPFDGDLKRKLRERLEFVNLPQTVLRMYPFELSGGMRQRVVMVQASLLDPEVMFADEITSALDVSTQKAVVIMLQGFVREGFVGSLAFITHDLSVLYQIADRVLVMYAGKVAEILPCEKLIGGCRHPYTKLLLSSLPKVGLRHTEHPLVGIPGQPPALLSPPKGCRFRERCPEAFERCTEEPPLLEVGPGHLVACWGETGDA